MDYTINNDKEHQIDKCLLKYLAENKIIGIKNFNISEKHENNIKIEAYYYNDIKIITIYEDQTSGEIGIIENWKVK